MGAPGALAWALWAVTTTPQEALRRLRDLARGPAGPHGGTAAGADPHVGAAAGADAHGGPAAGADPWPAGTLRVLARALPRWAPRLVDLDPRPALDDLADRGGVLVVPGTPAWPPALDDLGPAAPLCLWLRGASDLAALAERSVAVVGARAATAYGERIAGDLGAGLAERGVTVVSGGAFGVDVAAHRGALAVGGPTVALLAGGVDRPSPAGNLAVLERVVDDGGALVAESPPGTPPSRARFLQRNRVIAALTRATVVVEAAWRSGALSTAARAGELLRPVGAVPGPVTSMASVGCHRLLRDGAAVCVTDAAEVVELLDPPGSSRPGGSAPVAPVPHGAVPHAVVPPVPVPPGVVPPPSPAPVSSPLGTAGSVVGQQAGARPGRQPVPPVADRADGVAARALDALDRRRSRTTVEVARRAGLAEHETVAALGLLELAGAARRVDGRWRRSEGTGTQGRLL
nr:DNA-processing protein DprA [Cellulomonas sp. IC4_254]